MNVGTAMNVVKYWRRIFSKSLWQKTIVKLNIRTCQFVNYARVCAECISAEPAFFEKIAIPKN